jgi:hypothetical protein
MGPRLSPTMSAVLEVMKANGGTFVRAVHTYWTWPGCPTHSTPDWTGAHLPTYIAKQQTIDALVRLEVLEVTRRSNGEAVEVRIRGALVAA